MNTIKNIIFDLGGVLFEWTVKPEFHINESEYLHLFQPIEEGIILLQQCYKSKKSNTIHKLFICSNWGTFAFEILKKQFPDIILLFDGIALPPLAQAKKPDHKIYHYLLNTYNLKAEECLFLDDQEHNVRAAEALGMYGVHVRNFNEVKDTFKRLSIL